MRIAALVIVTWAMSLLSLSAGAMGIPKELQTVLSGSEILAAIPWWVSSEREPLLVVVSEPTGDRARSKTRLQVFRKRDRWVRLTDLEVGHLPFNLIVTLPQDGYLVTQWGAGSGHLVKVLKFSVNDGKPLVVYSAGAKDIPDLIFSRPEETGFTLIFRDERGGDDGRSKADTARIVVFSNQGVAERQVKWADRYRLIEGR